jgi:ribosomal protein S18 acetylase RimI-like enzyme
MMQELPAFARGKGYQRIQLETDPEHQGRAIEFYKKLGFYKMPIPDATDEDDILMEMQL